MPAHIHTQRTPIPTSIHAGVHTRRADHPIPAHTHAVHCNVYCHPISTYVSRYTRTHRHTRVRTDYRQLGKSCSLQPGSYLKRSIAGKGTKAKPAINSHLPPCSPCPPAAWPCLSSPALGPEQPRAARVGLFPGVGSRALETLWPSTEHWGRPGALGTGGWKGTQPATCSQPCVHVPGSEGGRPPRAGQGCCLSRTAKAGSCQVGEEGGSAKQSHSCPCPGAPFPAGPDLPWIDSWFVSWAQSRDTGWHVRNSHGRTSCGGGRGRSCPTLSSSSISSCSSVP